RATRSAAAAGASAAHALVATAVAHHDGAADVATGSVSHVDQVGEGVGCVDRAGASGGRGRPPYTWINRAVQIAYTFRRRLRLGSQVLEQELLLSAEEAHLQPAENVVHDRLGESDIGIVRPSARFEAGVGELLAKQFQLYTVL